MDKILEAFNWQDMNIGVLQEAINMCIHAQTHGRSLDELKAFITEQKNRLGHERPKSLKDVARMRIGKKIVAANQSKPCPVCGKTLRLLPVTGNERYKTKWLCGSGCGSCNQGGGCGYVEFNELSIEDIIKQGELK